MMEPKLDMQEIELYNFTNFSYQNLNKMTNLISIHTLGASVLSKKSYPKSWVSFIQRISHANCLLGMEQKNKLQNVTQS